MLDVTDRPVIERLLTAVDILYNRMGGGWNALYDLEDELLLARFWNEAELFRQAHGESAKIDHFWPMFMLANEIIAREYGLQPFPDKKEKET